MEIEEIEIRIKQELKAVVNGENLFLPLSIVHRKE